MRCGGCGTENLEGHKFCQWCGTILAAPIDPRDHRLDSAREEVVRSIRERARTDKTLSLGWVAAIIVAEIVSVIYVVVRFFSWDISEPDGWSETSAFWTSGLVSDLLAIATTVITVILFYLLVKRQNNHYLREARLRSSVINLIRAAAWSPERANDIAPEMMALSVSERSQEKQRNPWFWALIFLIPVVATYLLSAALYFAVVGSSEQIGIAAFMAIFAVMLLTLVAVLILELYLFYFLTKTMLGHDARWSSFAYYSGSALIKLGFPSSIVCRTPRLPERSMALYIVLAILTGIFVLYWYYVLVKDPNEHFKNQWKFEDSLLTSIAPGAIFDNRSYSR